MMTGSYNALLYSACFILLIYQTVSYPLQDAQHDHKLGQEKLFIYDQVSEYETQTELPKCRPVDNNNRSPQLFEFLDRFFGSPATDPETSQNTTTHINVNATPIVIWHGLGQSCCDPNSIGRVKTILERVTKAYVLSLRIGDTVLDDTINGFFKSVDTQVEMACKIIAKDARLAKGYHSIGFSQGGQFLRAVAQRCPNPPMKNLVTMGSQHQGIFGIPRCPGFSAALCHLMRDFLNRGAYSDLAQSSSVVAQYWQDSMNFDKYVNRSKFIAEINNERSEKNLTYAENLSKLERFVLVKNLNDSTVIPMESQHFEFFAPGNISQIVKLRESVIYTEDRIGLQKLDKAGKLIFLEVEGDHIEYNVTWFVENVVQVYLV